MLGAGLLLFVSIFTTAVLSFFQDLTQIWLPEAPISDPELWQKFAPIVPSALTYIVFLILYLWLPNIKLRFKDVWVTALIGALFFEILKIVFIYYVRSVSGMASTIYGGFSMVIILMIFIYISSFIMLVCAMMTSKYAFWLADRKQQKCNKILSSNLKRLRDNQNIFIVEN